MCQFFCVEAWNQTHRFCIFAHTVPPHSCTSNPKCLTVFEGVKDLLNLAIQTCIEKRVDQNCQLVKFLPLRLLSASWSNYSSFVAWRLRLGPHVLFLVQYHARWMIFFGGRVEVEIGSHYVPQAYLKSKMLLIASWALGSDHRPVPPPQGQW
jgi:hypothetical protein